MSEYNITHVEKTDRRALGQVKELLQVEGITLDKNLDYIAAVIDDDYNVIATGSCFGNTLRCFAVSNKHQGEGLLNLILTHLIDYQYKRGNFHLFLYTKIKTAKFFGDLGFYEIARVDDALVFMENKKDGFESYIKNLEQDKKEGKAAAIVMNANPFTNGHLYLIEKAASNCDVLHLFMVSEDASLVPFYVRKRLIKEGTAHIKNIVYHESGPYIISNATFPSYFLKDEETVVRSHAKLDIEVFKKIAKALNITERYVGEEKTSFVTSIYNEVLSSSLPEAGIQCHIIARKEIDGNAISASSVRTLLKAGDVEKIKSLVPESTYKFFSSPDAAEIIKNIQATEDVTH
ncbi:MAG: [citrate (pro-3S)-lyase] ligase [Treponema sp.]|nr:[citrate (pro-3S)-lyase] ligase [Treponema sp.]